MARLFRSVENQINPFAMDVYPFRFVDKLCNVLRDYDFLVLKVNDVEIMVVGRIAVRKIGIASAYETALPDVDPCVKPCHVQYIIVSQMNFSIGIRIRKFRQAEFLQQFVVSVSAAVGVDEAVLGIEAPVYCSSIIGSDIIDPLDDPAALEIDVSYVAATGSATFRDVEEGELGVLSLCRNRRCCSGRCCLAS